VVAESPNAQLEEHVLAATNWTRLLPASAMYRLPDESRARPMGDDNRAEVAAPPSPEEPEVPLAEPARV
jgi:hypothetical protein